MDDINEPTFARELERSGLEPGRKAALLDSFRKAAGKEARLSLLREVRGGSVTSKPATKLAAIRHTR